MVIDKESWRYMGQLQSTVIEVYAQWVQAYPNFAQKGVLVSGAPETKLSDVDISIFIPGADALRNIFDDCKIANYNAQISDHLAEGYFTLKFSEFTRPVNLRFTTDEAQLRRTLQHRMNEIHLCTMFPSLAKAVSELKVLPDGSKGLSTEKAWAKVLKADGDAYDYMAGPFEVLSKAAQIAFEELTNHPANSQ